MREFTNLRVEGPILQEEQLDSVEAIFMALCEIQDQFKLRMHSIPFSNALIVAGNHESFSSQGMLKTFGILARSIKGLIFNLNLTTFAWSEQIQPPVFNDPAFQAIVALCCKRFDSAGLLSIGNYQGVRELVVPGAERNYNVTLNGDTPIFNYISPTVIDITKLGQIP